MRSPPRSATASIVLPCDLGDSAAVAKLGPEAEAAMGELDILVNNAGITRDNLFMRMKDEEWDEVHRRQPHLGLPCCPARSLRGMMRRRFGRIIDHHLGGRA